MELKEKYQDVLTLGEKLGVQGGGFEVQAGKLKMWGTANYAYDKNRIWDKIKAHAGWESEIGADIKIANEDIYGVYTVEGGDTLGKIAKEFLGNGAAYMDIFNINKDQLSDPDKIKVGQKLKIPKRK